MYYFAVTAYDVEGNESDFSAEEINSLDQVMIKKITRREQLPP
jgi:hypothetical protein